MEEAVTKKDLTKGFNACGRSLERLQAETRKSLNLLALVMHFPQSMEPLTAARLQLDREATARAEYQREMRRLRALLKAWVCRLPRSHRNPFAGWGVEPCGFCGHGVSSYRFTR